MALKALQRELLALAPRTGALTPRSWELLGSITLAIMLLSLRFGGFRGRRQVWWALRACGPLEAHYRKAL
eukprot:2776287-Pyramimonas_sp.AAC.1